MWQRGLYEGFDKGRAPGHFGVRVSVVDELKISPAFVERMLGSLQEHDQQCRDPVIAAQYLSALCALLVAKNTSSEVEARSLLLQLYAFMGQICEAESTPSDPSGEAFGMWYPSGDVDA